MTRCSPSFLRAPAMSVARLSGLAPVYRSGREVCQSTPDRSETEEERRRARADESGSGGVGELLEVFLELDSNKLAVRVEGVATRDAAADHPLRGQNGHGGVLDAELDAVAGRELAGTLEREQGAGAGEVAGATRREATVQKGLAGADEVHADPAAPVVGGCHGGRIGPGATGLKPRPSLYP